MTEKKGVNQKIKDKLLSPFQPKQPINYEDETLSNAAIRITSDGKLEAKQADIDNVLNLVQTNFSDEPQKIVEQLEDRLKLLHKCITKHAAPYALGGDNYSGAQMMHGWNKMYHIALAWTVKARRYWLTDIGNEINKIHIHNMQVTIMNWIFPDAFDVLSYVYHKPEVRERGVTVIQTMTQSHQKDMGTAFTDE